MRQRPLRLLLGVVLRIVVGELTVIAFGTGYGALALATFAAMMLVRIVAVDLMTFAGVDPEQAVEAVREGSGKFHVPTRPRASRIPFGLSRWRSR